MINLTGGTVVKLKCSPSGYSVTLSYLNYSKIVDALIDYCKECIEKDEKPVVEYTARVWQLESIIRERSQGKISVTLVRKEDQK